ncbi:hypothetical protein ACOXH8_02865 [Nannocystis pusilla]
MTDVRATEADGAVKNRGAARSTSAVETMERRMLQRRRGVRALRRA